MPRLFMILFMVSVVIWLKENLLLILDYYYCFYTLLKEKSLIMVLILPLSDDIEVSLRQLKRFDESVVDSKCLLKIETTYICFDKNLSFSSNIIFSRILLFLFKKSGLHAFLKGLELPSSIAIWLIYSDLPSYCVVT